MRHICPITHPNVQAPSSFLFSHTHIPSHVLSILDSTLAVAIIPSLAGWSGFSGWHHYQWISVLFTTRRQSALTLFQNQTCLPHVLHQNAKGIIKMTPEFIVFRFQKVSIYLPLKSKHLFAIKKENFTPSPFSKVNSWNFNHHLFQQALNSKFVKKLVLS